MVEMKTIKIPGNNMEISKADLALDNLSNPHTSKAINSGNPGTQPSQCQPPASS